MSSIPDELFHDILSRLPAKSLLVCKCVCKNWFELISNPRFVHAHANLITQRNNFSLTKCYAVTGNEYIVRSIGYDSLGGSEQDEHADDMLFKGCSISSSTSQTFIDLLCSCNGLVCLYFQNKRKICLWNPATKEFKKLPEAPTSLVSFGFYDCALGYDYNINDYKFVTLVESHNCTFEILVYTLGSNCWKKLHNVSCLFTMRQSGVLFDGAFHWLGFCHSILTIISFDISNETSSDIQLPKEADPNEGRCSSLRVLEGRLSFVHVVRYCDYEVRAGQYQVILWVMQEYGVEESWSKRYVIKHERIHEHYRNLRLMWYFKNGEILFAGDRSKLFIYDPKYGSVRLANVNGLDITNGESYFETLVSLKSGIYVGGNGQTKLSIEDHEGEEEEFIQFTYY